MILLCGLPRVGKTSSGRLASQKLGIPFVDLDWEIEQSYSPPLPCRDAYHLHGPERFRRQESHCLALLRTKGLSLVALGGGVFEKPQNIETARSLGCVIYLQASAPLLVDRMPDLPAFLDSHCAFEALAKERSLAYELAAHHIVPVDYLSPDEIAERIAWLATTSEKYSALLPGVSPTDPR